MLCRSVIGQPQHILDARLVRWPYAKRQASTGGYLRGDCLLRQHRRVARICRYDARAQRNAFRLRSDQRERGQRVRSPRRDMRQPVAVEAVCFRLYALRHNLVQPYLVRWRSPNKYPDLHVPVLSNGCLIAHWNGLLAVICVFPHFSPVAHCPVAERACSLRIHAR